ncbi:hypothetical protein Syun_004149 [Stephania yunnanensis]|uniref:Uncharacterized protein n=1 Tax=Stephania yunnanensis TaxID=152371 RepID=A0AAP0L409_9MAGN
MELPSGKLLVLVGAAIEARMIELCGEDDSAMAQAGEGALIPCEDQRKNMFCKKLWSLM